MTEFDRGGGRIRVLVVDDHDLFRTGLASLLSLQHDIEVVAQASNGRAAVRLAGELRPDVVLMDLHMNGFDGIEATRETLKRHPMARVVAFTVASSDADVEAVIRAGACGFLVKDAPIDDVVRAVRAAAGGAPWLSSRAAEALMDHLRRVKEEPVPDDDPVSQLSPRELDVLRLIARGMENAQIAEELSISPRTAKNHVSSVLTKLGVFNRVQAAVYAVRQGVG